MKSNIINSTIVLTLLLILIVGNGFIYSVSADFFLIPHINVKKPQNTTYNSNSIPLSIVWSSAYWSEDVQIFYSLDAGDMVKVGNGSTSMDALAPVYWHNSTLNNLSNKTHLISVYALDALGNPVPDMSHLLMSTTKIYFTVEQITPEESIQFPTAITIASIATITIIGIGVLVYFKKYRK